MSPVETVAGILQYAHETDEHYEYVNSKGERVIYCNSRSVFLRSVSGDQPNVAYAGHVKES